MPLESNKRSHNIKYEKTTPGSLHSLAVVVKRKVFDVVALTGEITI